MGKPLEIWFQDEARVGQQGNTTRVWARRGTRPRAVRDTRYEWAYIFGAVCPQRGVGAGLVLPRANTAAMNLHLAEIADTVAPGAHAVVVLDGAGWHRGDDLVVPPNLTLLKLPPYAPELNSAENVWGIPAQEQARTTPLRRLPRHRRCLLPGLERLRRRPSPRHLRFQTSLGAGVMIYGGWYESYAAMTMVSSSA